MVNINYDKELDIFVVERQSYEDYNESLESEGFVLDLDSSSDFLGLEIIDASQKTSLTREELSAVEDAEVRIEREEEVIRANLAISLSSGETVISRQYNRAMA